MNFTLGSDPELFILDADGNLRSAIPLFKGHKDEPEKIPGGAVIHDNVAVEFGIDPANNIVEWEDNTRRVLRVISKMLPAGFRLEAIASAEFPDSELSIPEARQFGCSPDFDAYTIDMNVVPPGAAESNLRSCGGHIHIGLPSIAGTDAETICAFTKAMDIFLGLPGVLLDLDPTSKKRRELYGKAGCHRPKSYGVEYRSLGNFWVTSPKLTRLMWNLVRDGISAYTNKYLEKVQWHLVRATINDVDKASATKAVNGLVRPLLAADTKALLDECMTLPKQNIYSEWGL